MIGIAVRPSIGIGDAIQFSSVPENYFRTFNEKLVDMDHNWIFDHNPYVIRGKDIQPPKVVEMWDYKHPQPKPPNRTLVYLSNAERHAWLFEAKCFLSRPRLYVHEDYPIKERQKILIQTNGKSHGAMPPHIVDHVLKKYEGMPIFQIDTPEVPDIGIPRIVSANIWELVKTISECRMLIGLDSGPSWIAACFPDIIIKKVRTKPKPEHFYDWTPLEIFNIHSHWDDRVAMIYTPSEDDIGFTWSYKRI